jgi:hypothetical protein
LNQRRMNEIGVVEVNESLERWSMPWHARLKNLAEASRTVTTPHGEWVFQVVRAHSAAAPAGSWLGRARTRPTEHASMR